MCRQLGVIAQRMPKMSNQKTSDAAKLIWIAGPPRTGSMWTYNICRAVLERAGRDVFPKDVPQRDKQVVALAKTGLQDHDQKSVWVLKVHSRIAQNAPRSLFITTFRDPRDSLVSFKRFMRCDFDRALRATLGGLRLSDYYRSFPKHLCLQLEYFDIILHPQNVAQRITDHINCQVSSKVLLEAVEEFSKRNVSEIIRRTEENLQGRYRSGEAILPGELVTIGPGSQRALDLKTGFQSGHVSNYKEGDWRYILTQTEIDRVHDAMGTWLNRNGYEVR